MHFQPAQNTFYANIAYIAIQIHIPFGPSLTRKPSQSDRWKAGIDTLIKNCYSAYPYSCDSCAKPTVNIHSDVLARRRTSQSARHHKNQMSCPREMRSFLKDHTCDKEDILLNEDGVYIFLSKAFLEILLRNHFMLPHPPPPKSSFSSQVGPPSYKLSGFSDHCSSSVTLEPVHSERRRRHEQASHHERQTERRTSKGQSFDINRFVSIAWGTNSWPRQM